MNKKNMQELKSMIYQKKFGNIISGRTVNTLIQFFRYCFVGGGATVIDWGVSAILFFAIFGQRYAIAANIISFIAGLMVNYFLSTFWIFRSSKMKSRMAEFLAFAAVGVVGLLITAGITQLSELALGDLTNAYQIIGKIVSTMIAFLWNFFARKYLIFNKNHA